MSIKNYNDFKTEEESVPRILRGHNDYSKVTFLSYTNISITDLEGIEELINLEDLRIDHNKLSNLKGIENLIHLKDLYCYSNEIENLKELKKLTNLSKLYCANNYISSMIGTENLINLQIFMTGNNLLENFEYGNFSMEALELGIDETDLRKLKKLGFMNCKNNRSPERYKKYIRDYCKIKNIKVEI